LLIMRYDPFYLKMHHNVFVGRALPRSTEELYSASTDPVAGSGSAEKVRKEGQRNDGVEKGRN